MTIHSGHPFLDPDDAVRRLRARIGGAVSLWTAGSGRARAGLTVSSVMVANGSPAFVLGLVDPDSGFYDAFTTTGLAVVHLLEWRDRGLADAFGGVAPAPGGAFTLADFEQTPHGPRLPGRTHALVAAEEVREVGWSTLVTARIEEVAVLPDESPLEHRRGRYSTR